MADTDRIGYGDFFVCIGRAKNNVVIGTGDSVIITSHNVIRSIFYDIAIATNNIVVSRGCIRTDDLVIGTGNLRERSILYVVAITIDGNMAAHFLINVARRSPHKHLSHKFLLIFRRQRFLFIRVIYNISLSSYKDSV